MKRLVRAFGIKFSSVGIVSFCSVNKFVCVMHRRQPYFLDKAPRLYYGLRGFLYCKNENSWIRNLWTIRVIQTNSEMMCIPPLALRQVRLGRCVAWVFRWPQAQRRILIFMIIATFITLGLFARHDIPWLLLRSLLAAFLQKLVVVLLLLFEVIYRTVEL